MCGIAGTFLRGAASRAELCAFAETMTRQIVHRGPDDSGDWVDEQHGVALGFRRLSIIDLSPAGHQPMDSATGRYVIIFNGEVYNFAAIRAELEREGARTWRGHSDTEVILAAIERWGLEGALPRFNGMFAFALWDKREQMLHLVRDRMGVKPLYYAFAGEALLFGSELKSIAAHPLFRAEIDRDAVALYTRYACIPAPHTIYRNAWKLEPGSLLSVSARESRPQPRRWWDVREVAERATAARFAGSEAEAVDALDAIISDSVRLRMISDVPLGVFLSGGIDSSLVVAAMQAQNTAPVKTFSIGFHEALYDEAQYAAAVAKHLGTAHTELYVTPREAMDVIPLLPRMYDEPFADSSQIPTYLVSKLARQSVTVSLSGDGGDELFGGYHRYFLGLKMLRAVNRVPRMLRPALAAGLSTVPVPAWNRFFAHESRLVPRALRHDRAGERLHKLARALRQTAPDSLYREIVTVWDDAVPNARALPVGITDPSRRARLDHPIERMMFYDQISYLPDDILVKVDRASMAVSLEAREPLLDHRLVEFAWSLPFDLKVRERGKYIVRKLLSRYVPDSLIERPKMGFGVPIDEWLRGPLRDWAEALLAPARLREAGYFDVELVRARWQAHLAGRPGEQLLWTILMFEAWRDEQARA
ncbi:MAG TPA: asparagine synthase (glutamine-hydrolyzing) [Thermoanaerobaculia bacterium]|jgi:asparagine synthase (glutamine-hydrolysing)